MAIAKAVSRTGERLASLHPAILSPAEALGPCSVIQPGAGGRGKLWIEKWLRGSVGGRHWAIFGFEAYYSQLQISPGSESRWGCEAPAVRAGTPELKLKEDIPPEV